MPETYGKGWFGVTNDYGELDTSIPTEEEIAGWKQEYEEKKRLFTNGMYIEDIYDTYDNKVRYAVCKYILNHYCAYLCIPKNTPLGKIQCHGGITYTNDKTACCGFFKANEGETIIGWDYAHAGDEDTDLRTVLEDVGKTIYQMEKDGLLKYRRRY